MRDYIRNTLNWAEDSITYTDPNGTDYTNMHYWDGIKTFRSSKGNKWAGQIKLIKDMAA